MVEALETALNASPNDFHMLEQKYRNLINLEGAICFEETFSESDCDFYYVGDIKNGKPNGYGVITSGYNSDTMYIYYIGEFEKGDVKNCYGMTLTYWNCVSIAYEGNISYLTEDLYAVPADAEEVICLYPFNQIYNYYNNEDDSIRYEDMGLSRLSVAKCIPKYIGGIKNGGYSGKGILYYQNGTIGYEGEFKNGSYHGEGKEYSKTGELLKEGKFKYGELDEGKIYRESAENLSNNKDNTPEIGMQETNNISETNTSIEDLAENMYYTDDISNFLEGLTNCLYMNTNEYLYINDILYGIEEYTGTVNTMDTTIVDMNRDSEPELLIRLSGDIDDYYLVIHYDSSGISTKIFVVSYVGREFKQLQVNGVYCASSGASSSGYYMLSFNGESGYEEIELAYVENGIYTVEGARVSEEDFNIYYDNYINAELAEWENVVEQ